MRTEALSKTPDRGFQPPELWAISFCFYKASSLWYFVTAVQAGVLGLTVQPEGPET